jgi:hypothetical protein
VPTVGPNSDPERATTIGEAAHIYGARPGSKRFNPDETESARSAITNGIWLCRNCHGRVDADEQQYTSNVLFAWRELHEQFVQAELGSSTDRFLGERQAAALETFGSYPPLIRRIVIDQPPGWEWRLTAELIRHLNGPLHQRLSDLREGVLAAPQEHILEEEASEWVRQRLVEMSRLMKPFNGLIQRLNQSWGKPGEPGSVEEIHHICKLLQATLAQIVLLEERLYFANATKPYQRALTLLRDLTGSQVDKLAEIPAFMEELLLVLEEEQANKTGLTRVMTKTITFEAPGERLKELERELSRAESWGCLVIGFIILLWPLVVSL